jgi:hypothetical protein
LGSANPRASEDERDDREDMAGSNATLLVAVQWPNGDFQNARTGQRELAQ